MRLGYLYSRYPVVSQTFCDAEMLALERLGLELAIGSVHPPLTTLRHEHISCLRASIHYAPPQEILKISEKTARASGRWPLDLVRQHDQKYGPGAKTELRARCPDSAAKIHRIYNGIDLERFPTPRDEAARPRQGEQGVVVPYHVPHIVSVGRLVAFKGFEHLIDACAELARRGFDFTCHIVGDGPLRETLKAKIEKLNLSSRINLLGSLSQKAVLEELRNADVFALASVTDAQGASDVFPTVILEAMAAARPVLSTRLAGIPELVIDGETGVLVPPEDTSALAEALAQLV